ncbi:MAG: phage coat protein [Oscillospiraceae bacterium]|nr:phage coat protein [Oscillospiraceae bacterium]
MAQFDSKSFNPQAFGKYVENIPNTRKTALAESGAVGSNAQARAALSSQSGSLYARIPYFGLISGETSQNNDGATNIASTNTSTYEQGFVTASRMDGWTERSFSKNITAGVNFMDNVAKQIAAYKQQVKQNILLSVLGGIFAMSTAGDTVADKAAKDFIEKHTYDISGNADEKAFAGASTLNTAMQQACGDNKDIFKLIIMHSSVATNLENLRLLKYLTYTDKNGIQQDLSIGTWNGRRVLIDDSMPIGEAGAKYAKSSDTSVTSGKTYYTKNGDNYSVVPDPTGNPSTSSYYEKTADGVPTYTSYVLGTGSIILDNIGDSVPYEMTRDAKTNGGENTLYVRDRYIVGVDGISFEKPATITASAKNSDLAAGANWQIINNGETAISHKAIAIARIISKG